MTLKLTSTTNELRRGWNLAWYHHFTHIACAKKKRGLRQKLDALRVQTGQSLSIRVSDETSSFTKALHFCKLITTPDIFCIQYAQFKATSPTLNPFWHHLLFFMHLLICFELINNPEIEKHYKWTLKRLKLGMVSSFHPHSMWKKVERVTTKTECTSCTN